MTSAIGAGLSRTVPSGSMRAPFSDGWIPHESTILERQELSQLGRHRHENEVRLFTAGDALGHVVDAAQLMAPLVRPPDDVVGRVPPTHPPGDRRPQRGSRS